MPKDATATSSLLNFKSAAELLAKGDSKLMDRLDALLGVGVVGSAAFVGPQALTLLGPKNEVVKIGKQLVARATQPTDTPRHRLQAIRAAHTVLVVGSYFDALADRSGDLGLTADDQRRLAGHATASEPDELWTQAVPFPSVNQTHVAFLDTLSPYYQRLGDAIWRLLPSLVIWDETNETMRSNLQDFMRDDLPSLAIDRFDEWHRKLSIQIPEFAIWAQRWDAEASRSVIAGAAERLDESVSDIQRLQSTLAPITDQLPKVEETLDALHRWNAAMAEMPVVDPTRLQVEVEDLRVPVLSDAYVDPRFRLQKVTTAFDASQEHNWEAIPVQEGLGGALSAYLLNPDSMSDPLLILGQPGSGKSVLTKVLAANLPVDLFVPVRVELRKVEASASVQRQVEQALTDATGDAVGWTQLVAAGSARVPVVILDGFDELLQASGVQRTDYLRLVKDFQTRELTQGRGCVVIVTSRVSVAGRAYVPPGSTLVRLDPFSEEQVATWLSRWNSVNATAYAARGVKALTTTDLRPYEHLAGQPLLLLMLVLYDARANDLQRLHGRMNQAELYERLLNNFMAREGDKHGVKDQGYIEERLQVLSVVALGMFNRGLQYISEAILKADLVALDLHADTNSYTAEFRRVTGPAEATLAGFFFIHRAEARTGHVSGRPSQESAWEFLHATFGEYLIARHLIAMLVAIGAATSAASASGGVYAAKTLDDDLLHALMSHRALTGRAQILRFARERLENLRTESPIAAQNVLSALPLARELSSRRMARGFEAYSASITEEPYKRIATYSLNLHCLDASLSPDGKVSVLTSESAGNAHLRWHALCSLWQAGCTPDEWSSLVDLFRVSTVGESERLVLSAAFLEEQPLSEVTLPESYVIEALERDEDFVRPQSSPMQSPVRVAIATLTEISRRAPGVFDNISLPDVAIGEDPQELRLDAEGDFLTVGEWLTRLCVGGDWDEADNRIRAYSGLLAGAHDKNLDGMVHEAARQLTLDAARLGLHRAGKLLRRIVRSCEEVEVTAACHLDLLRAAVSISALASHEDVSLLDVVRERAAACDVGNWSKRAHMLFAETVSLLHDSTVPASVIPRPIATVDSAFDLLEWPADASPEPRSTVALLQLAVRHDVEDWCLGEGLRRLEHVMTNAPDVAGEALLRRVDAMLVRSSGSDSSRLDTWLASQRMVERPESRRANVLISVSRALAQ